MRCYIAGPMRGYSDFNFPAFHDAARRLRLMGHEPVNPAALDEIEGFDPTRDEPQTFAYYMARDLPLVCGADMVVVLPGWSQSKGAMLEAYVARQCGIPVRALSLVLPA